MKKVSYSTSGLKMWGKAKNLVKKDKPPSESVTNLEGADPELCITLLHRAQHFTSLKNVLKKADSTWMEGFLEQGGLSAIFDALQILAEKGFASLTDALRQLECVGCIKAVMNSQVGLDFIIHYPEQKYVRKLSEGKWNWFLLYRVINTKIPSLYRARL